MMTNVSHLLWRGFALLVFVAALGLLFAWQAGRTALLRRRGKRAVERATREMLRAVRRG